MRVCVCGPNLHPIQKSPPLYKTNMFFRSVLCLDEEVKTLIIVQTCIKTTFLFRSTETLINALAALQRIHHLILKKKKTC